jgi:hypothetical protein
MGWRAAWCGTWFALLTACGGSDDAGRPDDVVAEVSESISTVVNVRWTTNEPSIGYVEYGPSKAMEFNTPLTAEKSEEHALSLLGLTSDTVYYYRVVTWDGGNGAASDVKTIRTGDLPVGMPSLTLEGEGHDQLTLVPILGVTTAVTVISPQGEIVWYHTDDRDLDIYRVRLADDGKSVLYNAASVSGDPADNSELVRVALDGSEQSSIPVPLLAHDFVELPDGTLAAIVVEYRDFEGTPLRGDTIVEVGLDGTLTTVWSAWDCFDPAEVLGDDVAHGWTFANALDYDAAEDAYYLGMRNFSSITKINRSSGECEWVLGSSASTIEFAAGSARFLHQHQFEVLGDHILVFDNEGARGDESRVLEYVLDLEQNTATEVWSYTADPSVSSFVLGEPTRLVDGGTFINWSAAGQLERLTADGTSSWKLNTGAGFAFGFHTLADSLYSPQAQAPAP